MQTLRINARATQLALLLALLGLGACYDDVTTEFPMGLESLEENTAPKQAGPTYDETLVTVHGEDDFLWVHGRAYINESAGVVWAALKNPKTMVGGCAVDDYSITEDVEPQYEFSFQAHYFRDEIINIEWDTNFRYGTIVGAPTAPELAIVRYQKTYGNEVISLIEGSALIAPITADVTEVQYIEHLKAIRAGTSDMTASMTHRFATAQAEAHGEPLPPCP